jgi:hypothetical protein
LTSPKGILEDGEVNQQSIYPVIVHWAEDTFGRSQPAEYIPSDSTLVTGYILCWLTSPKGILCPVYYHWVYTLLVDFAILCPVYYHWVYTLLVDLTILCPVYYMVRSTSRVYTQ